MTTAQIPACGFIEPHFAHRFPDLDGDHEEGAGVTLLPCPGLGSAEEVRTLYSCPDWCVREDHQADAVTPDSMAVHYGPDFGQVGVQMRAEVHLLASGVAAVSQYEASVYLAGEASFVSDPDELRRVAADMVRAAEWLEAHR